MAQLVYSARKKIEKKKGLPSFWLKQENYMWYKVSFIYWSFSFANISNNTIDNDFLVFISIQTACSWWPYDASCICMQLSPT